MKAGMLSRMNATHEPSSIFLRPTMSDIFPAPKMMKMYVTSAMSVASWAAEASIAV